MLLRSILFIFIIYYGLPAHARPSILILGDSLSAGYRLQANESWVNLLDEKLKKENIDYAVINGSVSGATSADGLQALPNLLKIYQPQILVVALGSNDGLRGNSLLLLRNNLAEIIKMALSKDIKVLLIGFQIPSNYGRAYTEGFANVYTELSNQYKILLMPFMLQGFATNLAYFQADNLHPTAAAQPLILDNIWPYLNKLIIKK
jgi:acyl-CoA thioesterase-1